ncbi:hypothetical protein GCM10028832_38120 [Streptomyces sparsus]
MLRYGVPAQVHTRTWANSWVALRCESCGRREEWPQPELGCPCGALLWLPMDAARIDAAEAAAHLQGGSTGVDHRAGRRRPAFRPVTIRTARDAVLAAGQYLNWLGFRDVRAAENRPASGVDLRGPRVVARVDPTTSPTGLRAVETLWLNGLNESAVAVCFALAGYTGEARARADEVSLPLFVLDLTGTPQPVNTAADDLIRTGA